MSGKNQPLTSMSDDGDTSLGSMWSRSIIFKIVLIACGVFIVFFAVTLLVLIFYSASQQNQINSVQASYDDCMAGQQAQANVIASLQSQLAYANSTIQNQTQTIQTLVNTTIDLSTKLNNSAIALNNTLTLMKYWQIGTAAGGGVALITGGYATYETFAANSWKSSYNTCSANLNTANQAISNLTTQNSYLRSNISARDSTILTLGTNGYNLMPFAVNGIALKKKSKTLTLTECYNSNTKGYNHQADFITGCAGAPNSTFILFQTNTNHFGAFINAPLVSTLDTDTIDGNAFTVIYERMKSGDVIGTRPVFTFPTGGYINIGKGEIVVAPSDTSYTTVHTAPGTTFNIGDNYYTTNDFTVQSVIAYRVTDP